MVGTGAASSHVRGLEWSLVPTGALGCRRASWVVGIPELVPRGWASPSWSQWLRMQPYVAYHSSVAPEGPLAEVVGPTRGKHGSVWVLKSPAGTPWAGEVQGTRTH